MSHGIFVIAESMDGFEKCDTGEFLSECLPQIPWS
jgi:hypothetical protein